MKIKNKKEANKLNDIVKETLSSKPNFDRFGNHENVISKIEYYNNQYSYRFVDIIKSLGDRYQISKNNNTKIFLGGGGFVSIYNSDKKDSKKNSLDIHNSVLNITKSYITIISFIISLIFNILYFFDIIN